MKNLFTLAFLLILSTVLSAQNFATIGTKWGYNVDQMTYRGSYYLESVGDTTIAGRNCRKLLSQERGTNYPFTTTFYQKSSFFLHERNDSLFEAKPNGTFRLLFNFKLQVGDSFEVKPNGYIFLTRKVDTLIGTQRLTKWQFRPKCNIPSFNTQQLVFVDKIGALNGVIGFGMFCFFDAVTHSLCYFSNPNIEIGSRCIYTNSQDLPENPPLSISPNPVVQFLKIESAHPFSNYNIYDLTGKLAQKGVYTEGVQIDVSSLPKGIFILQLIDKQQLILHQKFIKM